jgi:hypothetical protein
MSTKKVERRARVTYRRGRYMTRPKKKEADRKGAQIHVLVTDEQKRAIAAAAAKLGVDVSAFGRECMIEKAKALGIKI